MIVLLKMVLERVLLQCCRQVPYYAVVIHYHEDLSVLSPELAVNRCQEWTLLFSNLTTSSCFRLRGLVLVFITSFFKEFPGSGSSLGKKNCIILLHFSTFSMSFFWWHIVLLNKDNEQLVPVCYLYATQDFADFYHILPKSPFFTKPGEFSISSSSCRHYFISLLPICEQLPFHLYAFQEEGTQTVRGVKVCCGFVWCCDVDNFISRSFSSTTLDFLMFFFWLLSTQQMLSCGRICKSKISLLSGCGCKMSFYMWSSVCFSCAHHFPFTYFEFICHFIAHSVSFFAVLSFSSCLYYPELLASISNLYHFTTYPCL